MSKKRTKSTPLVHKVIKTTTTFMNGEFVANGIDESGNPKFEFLSVKYCEPKAFDAEVKRLKANYGEVKQVDGHMIEVGFHEVINKENRAKEVTKYLKQFRYQDGEWKSMTPNKEGAHVEVNSEKESKWTTAQKWLVGIIIAACIGTAAWLSHGVLWK